MSVLRTKSKVTLGFGLALLLGAAGTLFAASADAEVQKLREQWRTALTASDIKALGEIFSDQLVYTHSDGRVQTKQEFLAPIAAGRLRFDSVTDCDTPRVHVYEASAIVSACYELKIGPAPRSRHMFLTAFVKEAGRWQIVAIQTTRLPDK
jgi:ketosteroid isomerase-like protein